MAGHKNAYDCIKAFSETDFTEDLKKFDVDHPWRRRPDRADRGLSDALLETRQNAILKTYPGGSHSLGDMSKDQLNADLLAFIKS